MEDLRPNDQRAKIAIILICIVMMMDVASLFSDYFEYDMLRQIDLGAEISDEKINANDSRQIFIGGFYLVVYIISCVTFIQWFRRAYSNLHTRINHLSHSEGWAAGSWFVPILNLFRPYQIMKEMYDETDIILTKKLHTYSNRISTNYLGLWWTLWILNNIAGQVVIRLSMNATTVEDLMLVDISNMISSAIGIPLGLVAIKVIKGYANVEPLLTEVNNEVDDFGVSSLSPQAI